MNYQMENEDKINPENCDSVQKHRIYQYRIENEDDLANVFWELFQDYPEYIHEVQRIGELILLFNSKEFTIVSESGYVDRQYRDSYYSYFSQKYDNFERNCVRLAFFEGKVFHENFADSNYCLEDSIIGTLVLRPLKVGNIGQTLLNPKKLKVKGFFRVCRFKVMIYGRKLSLDAFPYSSQDGESMTCAETVLYNLIYYYGNKYSEYRVLMPSEILQDIERESYERVLPSQGVYESNMAKVLSDAHFYPRIYNYDKQFDSILYTYVESGIPFILILPEHVVSCVGHGSIEQNISAEKASKLAYSVEASDSIDYEDSSKKTYFLLSTSSLCKEYIVMDDNSAPYKKTTIDKLVREYVHTGIQKKELTEKENDDIETIKAESVSIIVPLYRRIFIDAARAHSIFKSLFWENKLFLEDIRNAYGDVTWGTTKDNPFVWRMYLTASKSFKDFKTRTTKCEELKYFYMDCLLPRFIWVLEIGTILDYSDSKGRVEVILDATSSPYSETKGILSVGYKGHFVYVPDDLYAEYDDFEEDDDIPDFPEKITMDEFKSLFDYNFNLTRLFDLLYDSSYDYFNETYSIFNNSNLERNF